MTRNELSQKICEGISAVFGRNTQNPENWLYEQDYVRGHVSITEHALHPRDAMGLCKRLEEAIGHGVSVTSTARSAESYVFTIAFASAKDEGKYTDGKSTLVSGEKDGQKFVTDGKDVIPTDDPDKLVDGINKVTGSHFRKAEELIDERIKEATLALEGTGYTVAREDRLIRVTGPKTKTLESICSVIPEGDEYYGSGFESGDVDSVVVVLPDEILGEEELLAFIDQAVASILDAEEEPEPKSDDEWAADIAAAVPDDRMAQRMSFLKNADGLSLALSDEKFAQAVASVRDVYGNDKAEAVLTLRLGAKKARNIIEALGAPKTPAEKQENAAPNAFESLLDKVHQDVSGARKASPGVSAIISKNMVHRG